MLRISKKADYAIFLLCHLAQRSKSVDRLEDAAVVSAAELSELAGLSHSLVANLLKEYARAGILASVRGQNGGYRLVREACELNLREILAVVEGPVNFVECVEGVVDEAQASPCGLAGICPSKGPLQVLHNRIISMLEQTNLAELAQFSNLHGHTALTANKS